MTKFLAGEGLPVTNQGFIIDDLDHIDSDIDLEMGPIEREEEARADEIEFQAQQRMYKERHYRGGDD